MTTLSLGWCLGITFAALALTLGISLWGMWMRKKKFESADSMDQMDDFLTGRNSYQWIRLGLSFYAAGMGCWLLFAPEETGMTASWIGVIAYALSNASPFWLMIWLGPRVKKVLGGKFGYSVADFARLRYGKPFYILVSLCSLMFMFLFLSAEFTSIGQSFQSLRPGTPMLQTVIPVAAVTLIYTLLGGVPSSIATDVVQGCSLTFLALMSFIVIVSDIGPGIPRTAMNEASKATTMSVNAVFILWISTTMNQFLEHSMWQRVFAAESDRDIKLALFVGGACTIPTVFLFGAVGVVASAGRIAGIIDIEPGMEFSAFFTLLQRLKVVWLVFAGFLAMCLSTSTVDSLQTGILGMMATHLNFRVEEGEFYVKKPKSLLIHKVVCALLNVGAAAISCAEYSVLTLLLISNIVSCAVVPALAFGFYDRTTQTAAFAGFVSGILTILIFGWAWTKTFVGGFKWFTFPEGNYHHSTALTFIAVPIVTTTVIWLVSYFQCDESQRVENQKKLEAASRGSNI